VGVVSFIAATGRNAGKAKDNVLRARKPAERYQLQLFGLKGVIFCCQKTKYKEEAR
jgi:predicted nucleic acid-binding protein